MTASPVTDTRRITHENWREFAKCDGNEVMAEAFFAPEEAKRQEARSFCHSCPVKLECLAEALDATGSGKRPIVGVWGGMTERDRTYFKKHNKLPFGFASWMGYARSIREKRNAH